MGMLVLAAVLAAAQPFQDAGYVYNVTLVRAAPGRLLDAIDHLKEQSDLHVAAGDEPLAVIRHSQGDQWDLMVIHPVGSVGAHFAPARVAARRRAAQATGTSDAALAARWQEVVSWREETFFSGPGVDAFRRRFDGASYFHVEMFIALPGMATELYREREMENDYLRRVGRPDNLIFARTLGGAWDSFTLGFYRDIKHFAESADVPAATAQEAALAAGFEGADRIGTYLRSLIGRHNDTLATKVPMQ